MVRAIKAVRPLLCVQGILVGTIDQGIIYFIYLIDISFRVWILISGSVVERPPYQSLRIYIYYMMQNESSWYQYLYIYIL